MTTHSRCIALAALLALGCGKAGERDAQRVDAAPPPATIDAEAPPASAPPAAPALDAAPAPCSAPLTAHGVLHTSVADVALDGMPVQTRAYYKQDVDASEAGCVKELFLQLGGDPALPAAGCVLTLSFERWDARPAGLRGMAFVAGSACPGFWDAAEGFYGRGDFVRLLSNDPWEWKQRREFDRAFAPRWPEGLPQELAGAGAASICVEGVTLRFPGMAYTAFTRPGWYGYGAWNEPQRVLHVDLSDVVVTGDLPASGDPSNGTCYPLAGSCGPGLHDGGDGMCVPSGTCSPGHPIGTDGACAPFPRA